jgi:hypothetical protein
MSGADGKRKSRSRDFDEISAGKRLGQRSRRAKDLPKLIEAEKAAQATSNG